MTYSPLFSYSIFKMVLRLVLLLLKYKTDLEGRYLHAEISLSCTNRTLWQYL
jgi:hypothetical protein